jgi:hypothetical protein
MQKRIATLTAIVCCIVCTSVSAMYSVSNVGTWPKTWPAELEPLRKQSRSLVGPLIPQLHYEIPFANREEFEAAWPHLLSVKSKGAPIILLSSPSKWLGNDIKAGVRVHSPPAGTNKQTNPEAPLARLGWEGPANVRGRWMWATYIELVVDGAIVDLNRIPLPADTPIIDERFKDLPAR